MSLAQTIKRGLYLTIITVSITAISNISHAYQKAGGNKSTVIDKNTVVTHQVTHDSSPEGIIVWFIILMTAGVLGKMFLNWLDAPCHREQERDRAIARLRTIQRGNFTQTIEVNATPTGDRDIDTMIDRMIQESLDEFEQEQAEAYPVPQLGETTAVDLETRGMGTLMRTIPLGASGGSVDNRPVIITEYREAVHEPDPIHDPEPKNRVIRPLFPEH